MGTLPNTMDETAIRRIAKPDHDITKTMENYRAICQRNIHAKKKKNSTKY